MKSLLKILLKKLGYRFVKIGYYQNLININSIDDLDFYHHTKSLFKKDQNICCFDVGANIGQTAEKMRGCFPSADIHCFEPVQNTYNMLVANVTGDQNISTYNFALGATQDETRIFHRDDPEWNSLVKGLNDGAKDNGATSESIRIETLDNFVRQKNISRIHILKIDTEGYEIEVLKGARNCLQDKIIEALYLEVGFDKNDIQHSFFPLVLEELEQYDYGFSGLFEKSFTTKNTILYANALFCKRNT